MNILREAIKAGQSEVVALCDVDADALWQACMGCMARNSTLIRAQSPEVQERIKAAFVRHANRHLGAGGLELPMAFRICAGRKAGG